MDELREYLEDARENWRDSYWRLDHPEFMVLALGVLSGIIGLAFTVLQTLVQRRLLSHE